MSDQRRLTTDKQFFQRFPMVSFRSRRYPSSGNPLLVTQEYAMQYYAAFNIVLMLGVMAKVVAGGMPAYLIWWVVGWEALAIGLGNVLAQARLKRSYAEIFFVEEHFSLISIHEILHGREHEAFPMLYANPALSPDGDTITIHFHDLVVNLHRRDWEDEDFDLIYDWFYSRII